MSNLSITRIHQKQFNNINQDISERYVVCVIATYGSYFFPYLLQKSSGHRER